MVSAEPAQSSTSAGAITATLLDQGAGTKSAEQIAETIDFIGGVLATGAGTDLTYVNSIVMKDSYEVALDLMADVVQRPTFAPEEIERQRQQALSALKVAAEDPESVADRVIDRLIYKLFMDHVPRFPERNKQGLQFTGRSRLFFRLDARRRG